MTAFWIVAAALTAAVVGALLWPLLRAGRDGGDRHGAPIGPTPDEAGSNLRILRAQLAELQAEHRAGTLDDAQFAAARAELERRVLDETQGLDAAAAAASPSAPAPRRGRAASMALAVALPALALGAYWKLGNPLAFDPILAKPPGQATASDVETLVQRLADRMKANPDDPVGWALLGRAYAGLQRFDAARDAYAKAVALVPPGTEGLSDLLADYADALAMTQGGRLAGEPERLVQQALQAEPAHIKSLALAGSAAMERGDARAAVELWTRARRAAPSDSPFIAGLDASLAEARAKAGMPAVAAPDAPGAPAAAMAAGASLPVRVTVAPELRAQIPPGATLFVFARAVGADGAPVAGQPPLAVARLDAATLAAGQPVAVTLDDSMAMAPAFRLSGAERVVVGARVSRSGQATPEAGDLEGVSAPVAARGGSGTEIRIESARR